MRLTQRPYESLRFPRDEWSWLRPAMHMEETPDAFVWAARVGNDLWAWHPRGGDVADSSPTRIFNVIEINTDGSEVAAFGSYVKSTFEMQPPLEVEWVNALCVLERRLNWDITSQGLPPQWREALLAAGYEPHLGALAQRAKFKYLTLEERQLLFTKKWDPSFFELLESMPTSPRQALVRAIGKYNIGANHAKDSCNQVLMLCRKYGEKAAIEIISKEHRSGDEMRSALFKLSQPELSRLSDARIEKLRGLHLPPRTSIYGDPSFEKDLLKVTHTPRNPADWESFKDWVARPETAEKIADLLDLYN